MGGLGSGRTGRNTTGAMLALSLTNVSKHEAYAGRIEWTIYDGSTRSIGFERSPWSVRLSWGGNTYPVRLVATDTAFGGERKWFACPWSGCKHRVTKLYLGSYGPGCRHCYRLAFTSTHIDQYQRSMNIMRRMRKKLGGHPDDDGLPEKPKGMHWRTYWRLVDRYEDLERRADLDMANALNRFMALMG